MTQPEREQMAAMEREPELAAKLIDEMDRAGRDYLKLREVEAQLAAKDAEIAALKEVAPFGSYINFGLVADRDEWKRRAEAAEARVEDLERQATEDATELDRLLAYARKVRGSRDVHNVYEVFDWMQAQLAAAREEIHEWEESDKARSVLEPIFTERISELESQLATALEDTATETVKQVIENKKLAAKGSGLPSRADIRRIFRRHHGAASRVARELGVSHVAVSQWLRGKTVSARIETECQRVAIELIHAR